MRKNLPSLLFIYLHNAERKCHLNSFFMLLRTHRIQIAFSNMPCHFASNYAHMHWKLLSFITAHTLNFLLLGSFFLLFINFNFYSQIFLSKLSSQKMIANRNNNLNKHYTYFLPKAKTMSCEKDIFGFEEVECICWKFSERELYRPYNAS